MSWMLRIRKQGKLVPIPNSYLCFFINTCDSNNLCFMSTFYIPVSSSFDLPQLRTIQGKESWNMCFHPKQIEGSKTQHCMFNRKSEKSQSHSYVYGLILCFCLILIFFSNLYIQCAAQSHNPEFRSHLLFPLNPPRDPELYDLKQGISSHWSLPSSVHQEQCNHSVSDVESKLRWALFGK